MQTADVRPYLNPSELYAFDLAVTKAREAKAEEQRIAVAACQARTPGEPRVPRRPLMDKHNVDGARRSGA